MASLIVGGVSIPVAPGSGSWDWNDAIDRRRAFDNTYRASATGGAARDGRWATPPVTRANAGIYRGVLQQVAAQMCSGDLIEIPTMCCAELLDESPVKQASGSLVVLDFALHEVQGKKMLLKYSPGDTITGESFTRSTTATYRNSSGQLASAAINVKRDNHYIGGVRSLLLEDARINFCTFSEDLMNAAWIKGGATISANAATAPDGTVTADKIQEDNTNAAHYVARSGFANTTNTLQPWSFFALAGERSWVRVTTTDRAGISGDSWINLSTGAIGTLSARHSIRVTPYIGGWYRIECVFDSGSGAGALGVYAVVASGDGVATYAGTTGSGIYVWGGQFEQDNKFASSYIPANAGTTVTRNADSYSLPFTTPPQEISVYAKFVEGGSVLIAGGRIFEIGAPSVRFLTQAQPGTYGNYHGEATAFVTSVLAGAPALGDTVELVPRLFGDGSTDLTQSLNGAAVTSSAQSVANPLGTAFSALAVKLNSDSAGGSNGFTAIQSFKIVAGARSLDEMRAA